MKKNILIVDDSSSIRRVIRGYLSDFPGAALFEAGNGEEAEAIVQEQNVLEDPIHLIMLDWMMPRLTGVEFLERLRAVPAFSRDPRVVMLTAETYPEQIMACLKLGVSSYLTKPFTQEDLVNAVTQAFRSKE